MSINKDQVKGRAEEAKGAMKETAGKAMGNASMEINGNAQKNLGKTEATFGDIKHDLKKSQK
jgi:uncharacterized protein YjbJ (UPF0337 family)